MKKHALSFASGAAVVALAWLSVHVAVPSSKPQVPVPVPQLTRPARTPVEVHFSPRGGCTETVVREIDAAQHEIRIQAYSFTSQPIGEALIRAVRRGVKVEAVVDSKQFGSESTIADDIYNVGASVLFDAKHAIAHNKIFLIDGSTIITGSFNFTQAAERSNAENLLVIKGNTALYQQYLSNYSAHLDHSVPFASMKRKG